MGLSLTSRQIAALHQLQTTVLATLSYASLEDWTHHVLVDLENIVAGHEAAIEQHQPLEDLRDRLGIALHILRENADDAIRSAAFARQLMQQLQLTHREAQVTQLLARGFTNDEIARELSISRHTVRHHCEWVFLKLGVHTRKAMALEIGRRLGRASDVHPIPGK